MTFSLVARCPRTNSLGVVTATCGMAIGSAVPHAEEGVGAIATQHSTNIFHGFNGLRLLKYGYSPEKVLKSTLDLDPNPEIRQVFVINSEGLTAAYTGNENSPYCGHIIGKNYVAGGNIVVGPQVIEAMVDTFEKTEKDPLHERLVQVIDAGFNAGGCTRPDTTTALLVVGIEDELKLFHRPNLDLRIDYSDEPTKDLRNLYERYKKWVEESKRKKE